MPGTPVVVGLDETDGPPGVQERFIKLFFVGLKTIFNELCRIPARRWGIV